MRTAGAQPAMMARSAEHEEGAECDDDGRGRGGGSAGVRERERGSGKFHTYFVLVKFGEDLNELRHPHVRLLLQEHDPGGVLPEGVRQAAGEDDATPRIKPKK